MLSLDFELYWGVRDVLPLQAYRENLLGVRAAIPALLEVFAEHGIHATWAVVGLLFFKSREELQQGLPRVKPDYENGNLSIYRHLETIGSNEEEDPFHYAPSLIRLIAAQAGQEVGTHTFSHYYCLEKGQDAKAFASDLQAARAAAAPLGLKPTSLVFPRNQYNPDYLGVCRESGIGAYRGIQSSWMYRAVESREESAARRALRLLDSYFNISGHNCHSPDELRGAVPLNIPASRFLRPYSARLRCLEGLRLKRIRDDMSHAAARGLVYHLWWHPHNFGANLGENIAFLKRILSHYDGLREAYGMQSLTMSELADHLLASRGQR